MYCTVPIHFRIRPVTTLAANDTVILPAHGCFRIGNSGKNRKPSLDWTDPKTFTHFAEKYVCYAAIPSFSFDLYPTGGIDIHIFVLICDSAQTRNTSSIFIIALTKFNCNVLELCWQVTLQARLARLFALLPWLRVALPSLGVSLMTSSFGVAWNMWTRAIKRLENATVISWPGFSFRDSLWFTFRERNRLMRWLYHEILFTKFETFNCDFVIISFSHRILQSVSWLRSHCSIIIDLSLMSMRLSIMLSCHR